MEGGQWQMMRQTKSFSGGNTSKKWGANGEKQLGLWETGPRGIPGVLPESISLAWLGF